MDIRGLGFHFRNSVPPISGLRAANQLHNLAVVKRYMQVFHRQDVGRPAKDFLIDEFYALNFLIGQRVEFKRPRSY